MTKKKRVGQWMDDLYAALTRPMHIETSDGGMREGRFTGMQTREIEINGETRECPTRIELNGDPSDYVDLDRVVRITID